MSRLGSLYDVSDWKLELHRCSVASSVLQRTRSDGQAFKAVVKNSSARKSHELFTEKSSNRHILQIYLAHEKLRFISDRSSGVFRSLNHSGDVRGCERQLLVGCCRRRNHR